MSLEDGIEQINKAQEKDIEEQLHTEWVVQLPFMSGESYVSFRDYADRRQGKLIDMRPTELLMRELDEIEQRFGGE